MGELWTEKFVPKNESSFIGNSDIFAGTVEWANKWDKGDSLPPLLLWGQSGSGKTSLAYLIAKKFNWSIIELNSSDLRNKQAIEKLVGAASQNASFFSSKRLILLDEVDALTRNDRGGASAIASIIKSTHNPIILTANDIFSNKNVSNLRFVCKTFEFKKINYLSMAKYMREILDNEGVSYDEEAIKELAKNSAGDMRSALLDLQTLAMNNFVGKEDVESLGSRERQQKVFSVMKAIFKGTVFSEVRAERTKTDLSSDMLFNWVEENIPRQYKGDDIVSAFEVLSRADVFKGRIFSRQHWGFLRYSTELASEGVALAKRKVSHDFVMYQFPQLLSMLSRSSPLRSLKRELGKKVGSKTHSSSRTFMSKDLPFYEIFFTDKKKAVELTALFDLTDKEVAFLLGTKPETKKVKTIIDDASILLEECARPKPVFSQQGEKHEALEQPDQDLGKQTKLF